MGDKLKDTVLDMFAVTPGKVGMVKQSVASDDIKKVIGGEFIRLLRYVGDIGYDLYVSKQPTTADRLTVRCGDPALRKSVFGPALVFRTTDRGMTGLTAFDELVLRSTLTMERYENLIGPALNMTVEPGKRAVRVDGS
jgi:hypothetical protein